VWASTFGPPRWTRRTVFVNWPLEWVTELKHTRATEHTCTT
jgi:hypothetical protein